jgi:hypothetical protein
VTTYYEKRGRRYYPVAESDSRYYEIRKHGFYLEHVKPGSTSRTPIDPKMAEVEAAMRLAYNAMIEAMHARCTPTGPQTRHVPEREKAKYQKAWDAWAAIVGDVPMYFEGVSMHDVVAAGLEALRQETLSTEAP